MKTIELRHNPFLETTILNIDGKEAHLNCIGTGEGHRLQEWKDEFFPQVIKKINIGPGSSCAVVFFGIQEDFDNLQTVHDDYQKQHEDIKVILDYRTKPPVTLAGKQDTLNRLMDTAGNDLFGGVEVKERCDAIRNKEFPSYVDGVGKLKEQATEFNSLIMEQNLPDKAAKHLADKKAELDMVVANINEAKRFEVECSVTLLDELEQNILKAELELLQRGYDETIKSVNATGSVIIAPVAGTLLKNVFSEGTAVTSGQTVCIIESMKMELEIRAMTNGSVHYFIAPGSPIASDQPVAEIKIPVEDIHTVTKQAEKIAIAAAKYLQTALIQRYCGEIEKLFSDSALEGFHASLPCNSTEISEKFIREILIASKKGISTADVVTTALLGPIAGLITHAVRPTPPPAKEVPVVIVHKWFAEIKLYFEGELAKVNESLKAFIAEEKIKQQNAIEFSQRDHEDEKLKIENEIAELEGDIVRVNSFVAEVNTVLNIWEK